MIQMYFFIIDDQKTSL